MLCPECKENNIQFVELGKQGCARNLMLECQCGWDHTFWSSEKVNNKLTKTEDPAVFRGFDINKRFFYAMRSCGQGYAGMETFCTMMDMPPHLTRNNYDKQANGIYKVVKAVAKKTMLDAASEIHLLNKPKDENGNDFVDCAVSCDGSWQRRGFSSLNGYITAISMDTGKIVDAEIMSRYCKGCVSNEKYKSLDPI